MDIENNLKILCIRLKSYSLDYSLNMNETGLFWKMGAD